MNIDVSEDISTAIILARIKPRKPFGINLTTTNGLAISVHDTCMILALNNQLNLVDKSEFCFYR